jgi:hypothetical protein
MANCGNREDMDVRLREDAKWAGVYGHVGHLIDRPAGTTGRCSTLADGPRFGVHYAMTCPLAPASPGRDVYQVSRSRPSDSRAKR